MDTEHHSGIVRAARRDRFVTISNDVIRDERLSYRARGLLATILSRPDGWRTSVDRLAAEGVEGHTAVKTAMRELVDAGYVVRTRRQRDDGRWTTDVVIYDEPQPANQQVTPTDRKPTVGEPTIGFPSAKRSRPRERPITPPTPPRGESEPDGFADWYARYPRHVGRRAAARAYRAALRRGATVDRLAEVLTAWLPELRQREARFVPHPSTFLNSGDAESPPPFGDGADVYAEHVVVGRRYITAERADPTLTALWHRIESLRARSSDPAVAAERADAESTYAERAAATLNVEVVDP